MWPRLQLAPAQWALVSLSGGCIASSGFLLLFFDRHNAHPHFVLLLAASFGLLVLGYAVSFRANARLENGMAADLWASEQVESLRSTLESPFTRAATIAILITACLGMWAFKPIHNVGWALLLFLQSINMLCATMRRPRPRKLHPLVDWQKFRPIQSDHWGEQ